MSMSSPIHHTHSIPGSSRPRDEPPFGDSSPRPHKMSRREGSVTPLDSVNISATITFSADGRSFCSRAVCCSPEPEPPHNGNELFSRLPPGILSSIFEDVAGATSQTLVPSDELKSALWTCEADQKAFERAEKERRQTLLSLKAVCRLFRHTTLPLMYSIANVVPEKPANKVEALLLSCLPKPEGSPMPSNASVLSASTEEPEASSTVGGQVRTLIFANVLSEVGATGTWAQHCPSVDTIVFTGEVGMSDQMIRDLSRNLAPSIRRICGLAPARNGNTTIENVLGLLNFAQELRTFSVRNLTVTAATAARLLFILRLNARLHPGVGQGSGSAGLTTLSFGHGSSISRVFLDGLHEATPNLRHFHISPGCAITSETGSGAGSGSTSAEFDLGAFVAKVVSKLETWTFVSNSVLQIKPGFTLEKLIEGCPKLEAAHIRADQISFAFFHPLADFATAPAAGSVVDLGASEATVPTAAAASALHLLRIQHSYSASHPQSRDNYIQLESREKIADFAHAARMAEQSGIVYPSAEGSQKDLLTRLEWLFQARAKEAKRLAESEASRPSTAGPPSSAGHPEAATAAAAAAQAMQEVEMETEGSGSLPPAASAPSPSPAPAPALAAVAS